MKKKILLSGLVAGVILSVVGCGGSSDEGESIVGTWTSGCNADGEGMIGSEIVNLTFEANGTGIEVSKNYLDNDCHDIDETHKGTGAYKTGELTKDDHGKTTIKLNIIETIEDTNETYYTMYRFKENGNLLIADDSAARPGDTEESRANEIDPNIPGFARVP